MNLLVKQANLALLDKSLKRVLLVFVFFILVGSLPTLHEPKRIDRGAQNPEQFGICGLGREYNEQPDSDGRLQP